MTEENTPKLSEFISSVNEEIEEIEQENLVIVSEADPIESWEILPVKDADENLISFVVFTSQSGVKTVLPLQNENVNKLLAGIITQTPDLDRDTIPMMEPMFVPFKKKYKKTIILTSTLAGLFIVTGILSTQFWLLWS